MERIFEAKECPDEKKLAYTQYLLTGEAGHWWNSMKMILEISGTPCVRFAKEVEFLELVQGSRIVSEYANRFKHLLHFNTMAVNEEWQCRKFENGLRNDIKLLVKGLRIREFPTLVEMSHDLEKTKKESEGKQSQPTRNGGPSGSRDGVSTKKTPYVRPSFPFGSKGSSYQPSVQSGPAGPSDIVRCYTCGGPHYRNNYPMRSRAKKCFKCGKEGHFGVDCTSAVGSGYQAQRTGLPPPRGGGRPQAMGRVYALVGSEAVSSASGLIGTFSVCIRYPIVIKRRQFKVNLTHLPLQGLGEILRMDWLSMNRILINCDDKEMSFPDEDKDVFVDRRRESKPPGRC
ncbi:uncharacterized protein LOC128195314 [Vigna angularis]|uniref:uncharacterized protein LOC128195314 n=1 Tax=Phaseolus angularis TaxID=3914 RepID=UPI0022B3B329|nr:uncharacterized protein LOC128195314 [Vigna angularis]